MKKIKKMATGGGADPCAGKPKKPGCYKQYGKRSIPPIVKKIGTAAAAGTAAILANKKYGLVDKAKEALGLKKGGAVKKTIRKKK